jgi:hypothetical protein
MQVFNLDGLIDPHARVISWRRGTVEVGNFASLDNPSGAGLNCA